MTDKNEPIDTGVRKLRKDGSWIRKQDDKLSCTTSKPVDLESKPLVKRNSFVLTAVKRYESKEPTRLATPPDEKNKTGNVKTCPTVDSTSSPELVSNAKITPKELATREVQPVNDTAVAKIIKATPEKATDFKLKQNTKIAKPVPPADTDDQTALSEQDAKGIIKDTADVKPKSSPKVPVTNETSLPNTKQPVVGGLSEVPAVKGDVKITERTEDPILPEPSTVIRAERVAVCTTGETTAPNSEQPPSQGLSKAPTGKAATTSGESKEKPVALPERVPVLNAKSEVQLADDAPVEPSVESPPNQSLEDIPKKVVEVEPSPNTKTFSGQDANKTAKAVEAKSSPEVTSVNKETVTDKTTLPKSIEPVPNGLSEVPAAKADVKTPKSQGNTAPLPDQFTVIRAEKVVVCTLEDETVPPNSEQPLSQNLSKTLADKELVSALGAKSEAQSADDAPVKQSVESTSEQASEHTPKKVVNNEPSPNTDSQTSSEQELSKIAKAAAEAKVGSSPEVPSANKATDDTSLPKNMPSLLSGLPEASSVKADAKSADSQEDPSPLPEQFTVITAEKVDVSPVEDEITPLYNGKPVSNNSSQSPAPEPLLKLVETKKDSAAAQEPVSVITSESEVQSTEDGVVEQMSKSTHQCAGDGKWELTRKENVEPLLPAGNNNKKFPSKQEANKVAEAAGEIEVDASPDVPSTNKETATNETAPSKRMPSVPSGLSEAPAVKVDVKAAESQENPASLPEPFTVIRAKRATGCTPENKTTPPNSEQPFSQGLSKTPADKAAITSGETEEKPVALPEPVPAVKAKSEEQMADNASAEPSVVSTPEQVSKYLPKKPVKIESSPNTDTQTSSEQDANKIAKVAAEVEVSSAYRETIADDAALPKREPVPSGLSEAPAVKADVKPAESQEDPAKKLVGTADMNINNMVEPVASIDSTSPFKHEKTEKVTAEIVKQDELESIPDILTLNKETLVNDTTTSNIKIPATDSWRKSPPAEILVKAAEREVNSAAPPERVPGICAESAIKSLDDDAAAFKQSDEATSEHTSKQMPALKTDSDVQIVPVADNDDLVHKLIKLTDALDVEAPAPESVLKAVDVPEPHLPQDSGLKQPHADSKNSEDLRKIADDLSSTKSNFRLFNKDDICTYCNQIFDGNAKIIFSEPSVICHPQCLKCEACVQDLGSLKIPMFLCDGKILCVDCYRKA